LRVEDLEGSSGNRADTIGRGELRSRLNGNDPGSRTAADSDNPDAAAYPSRSECCAASGYCGRTIGCNSSWLNELNRAVLGGVGDKLSSRARRGDVRLVGVLPCSLI